MTRNPTQLAEGDTTAQGWEATLRQILAATCVSALVYLVEKAFIQFVAVNFHKVSYEQRIVQNKHDVNILAKLYEQSRALYPTFTQDFADDDELLMRLKSSHHPGHHSTFSTSGTTTPTMRAVLGGAKKAVSAFGSAAQEITGKRVFQATSPHTVVIEALNNAKTCSSLARRLWFSFAEEGETVLRLVDLEEVLGDPDEAREAAQLFDKVRCLTIKILLATLTLPGRKWRHYLG
jgi:hypothetical protein